MNRRLRSAAVPAALLALAAAFAPAPAAAPDATGPAGPPVLGVEVQIHPNVTISLDGDEEEGAVPSVAVSDNVYVPKGEIHEGDIVNIFGDVNVEGIVSGDVVVILGSLRLAGTIEGSVVTIFSGARLEQGAAVEQEMVNVGGRLSRSAGSRVEGELVNINLGEFVPFAHGEGLSALARFWLFLKLASLGMFFLVVLLLAALIPRRLSVIAAALPKRWGWALLTGLAAYAAFVVAFLILFVSILGIPLALALGLCMMGTKWIGLTSILYLVGRTAGRNLFQREPSPLASALGGFAIYAVLSLIPLLDVALGLILNALAVGIALLTRYGSEEPWRRGLPGPGAPARSAPVGTGIPPRPAPEPPPVHGS
ncbi:MAG: hypothetical protein ACRD5D_00365 [Candidatus Polarisedimenticolia bacterium]